MDTRLALKKWLDGLTSGDPQVRKKSIKSLEELGDLDALPGLATVFATDPVPELRLLAQTTAKAIYYGAIRRQFEIDVASDAERRQAAEILARAKSQKRGKHRQ